MASLWHLMALRLGSRATKAMEETGVKAEIPIEFNEELRRQGGSEHMDLT